MERTTIKEDYGIVLDFLPHGRAGAQRRIAIAQVLGENHFVLLEVVPRKSLFLKPGERIYIGPEKRDKIHHVVGRISYSTLTETAKMELQNLIEKIVNEREKEFVDFFNKCGSISTRLHTLEILPGIGKKHMWDIIDERKKEPFKSFDDIKERIKLIPDPRQSIIKRILEELQEKDKYKLFVG